MAVVQILGDTHCPAMKTGYVAFLQSVQKQYKPDRIVHIGDLVDWSALTYHERHSDLPGPRDEMRAARRQVARITEAFPKVDILLGNHDCLTDRQMVTAGLPPELLRSFADIWRLPRGWTVHERFSSITIEGVAYMHGETGPCGQGAALRQAKELFRNVVIGHAHSQAGATWFANSEFRVFGLSVGCGIDKDKLSMRYGRKFTRKPILGCGIVIDGYQAIFVPWRLRTR